MAQKIQLHAEVREDVGKGASRRLRRAGELVPGIIYGAEADPVSLTLGVNELTKAMQQEGFFSQILDVVLDGKGQQAVVRDVQRNPATEKVLHIDFMRISANRAIQVSIPLRFVNEDKCKGVRAGGGNIAHAMTEVEINCLPANLPEFLEVYMAELDLGETIHLSDLALPEGVEIVALAHGDDRAVVSVQTPRGGLEEEEAELAEAAAMEAEGAPGEGEPAAEAGDAEDTASED